MGSIEDIKRQYAEKLNQTQKEHENRSKEEIRRLRENFRGHLRSVSADELDTRVKNVGSAIEIQRQSTIDHMAVNAQVNLTYSNTLQKLDSTFFKLFDFINYYPAVKLSYPTIYCETLEEFYTPFLEKMNYSEKVRSVELAKLIKEARIIADKMGGGTFGVNFPERGCYLNGWLFGHLAGINPADYESVPEVLESVLGTATHEKLGHGFLSVYSALGELKTSLGLSLVQIASQFGFNEVDDAGSQLKYKQNSLLFKVTQFLEEGWATWIENYLTEKFINTSKPRVDRGSNLVSAMCNLPDDTEEKQELEQTFMAALSILLDDNVQDLEPILESIKFMGRMGDVFDEHFMHKLGQSLRYVLGELLCNKCEQNLGEKCVPYAALIAANVTFDPGKIGFSDLSTLLLSDPRLHPDARLVAISKIKLADKGNVSELVNKVYSELSFSIPRELKK